MPNINAVLNDQIRRLSRREINANTKTVKRATAHYRRDIATLKRQVTSLRRDLGQLQRQSSRLVSPAPMSDQVEGLRFRADGLKTHRAKLGLSAEQYAKLVGVSSLTIYHWEGRKARPRKTLLPRLAAVRGMGKREAMQRLGLTKPNTDAAAPRRHTRGVFKQTGEQTILSLLQGRRSLITRQINEAWRKEGRGGTADVTLGLMVKAKKLKRTKIKGQHGSEYKVV